MVEVRFINDTTPIQVTAEEQETSIGVQSENQLSEVTVGGLAHGDLSGRNLPDQHPISAITGLAEALQEVSDKSFVFEQEIPTDTWHIVHTLNKRAGCVAVDSAGEVQIPDKIRYVSDNEIIATFLAPFAGKAYLN